MKINWHRISIKTLLFPAILHTRQNGVENRDKAYYFSRRKFESVAGKAEFSGNFRPERRTMFRFAIFKYPNNIAQNILFE